ncbi:hypothetical protein FQN54_009294 [Arachnomyces sp. PD_36]|nr:hypothetical protein FQN54_009294 [Arachnomyces sp. PD_36]
MKTIVNDSEPDVRELQISTNYDRSMVFTALRDLFDVSKTELFSKPPKNNIITGFVATIAETGRHFAQLGLQSQPSRHDIFELSKRNEQDAQCLSQDEMQYDLKLALCIRTQGSAEYQTSASLTQVRRIAASIGSSQRSRSSCHISGLKLDYHDRESSTVVGQWMNEYDAMNLRQYEVLQALTVWLVKEGVSRLTPGLNQGRIAAILVQTNHGQSKRFGLPDTHPIIQDCVEHQCQSGPQETLVSSILYPNIVSEIH